jgi:hypothetical protein
MALGAAGALLTYFTKSINSKTLDIMKQEYQINQNNSNELKRGEIESCATIKLMVSTNKYLNLANLFRYSYLKHFLKLKTNGETDCPAHSETIMEPFSECQLANKIQSIKEKIDIVSSNIISELKQMEQSNCNQEYI